LNSGNLSSELDEDVEAVNLVLFGDHLDHLYVTLALDTATFEAFPCSPVDSQRR
jgi:hypothetical protein